MKNERRDDKLMWKILKLMRIVSPTSTADIAQTLNAKDSSVATTLYKLKKGGFVGKSRSVKGYWYINREGEEKNN